MKTESDVEREGTEEKVLNVRTLGRFSVYWGDTLIVGGSGSTESQFTYLLQILLHSGKSGVSRSLLEEALFGERDISNVRHATQSVIYNAKKKLKQAGLPNVNYIEQRDGVFYWTDKIPVREDAAEFERLYNEAEKAEVLEERIKLYSDACYRYTGEFLPSLAAVIWAAHEARRYQAMFCDCVEKAVELLRIHHDYDQMEDIGRYAAQVQPLSNWEIVTMEALAALGRYDDARKLYDDTVSYYLREQGMRPSKKMMELMSGLGEQMQHTYEVLDTIQKNLSGFYEEESGGYFCSYPVFQGIYRMVERIMERGGQSVYLMLCTVVDGKGNPMKEGAKLEDLSQRLKEAIRSSIRHSDAFTQYGRGQCLVLLVNTTLENCAIIQKRINYHFIVGRQRSGIQYYVNSVISTYGWK